MSGDGRPYWPTRQQLIVIGGEPDQVAEWFAAVREHHEAARDVIDLWDEPSLYLAPHWINQMGDAMERLRRTLWAVRQWDVADD